MGLIRKRKPKYDLNVGEQYGNWLIIDKIIDEKTGIVKYIAQCQCEFKTISERSGCDLVTKDHKNCIKCHNTNQGHKIDIGDKFRNWTVIEQLLSKNGRYFLCECECKFKTRRKINSSELVNGTRLGCIKCCHDHRRKSIIGKTINNWTVLEDLGYTGKRRLYKCRCNCVDKTISTITWNVLISRKCQHCKMCCPKGLGGKFTGCGLLSGHKFASIKSSAKDRDIDFNIDLKTTYDLYIKQDGYCALTGLPIFLRKSSKEKKLSTASLDRINSSNDYDNDNVQWVHKIVNRIKWIKSQEDFLKICQQVVEFPFKKNLPIINYKIRPNIIKQKGSYGDISISNWKWLIRNAKVRNKEFNITIEYLWNLFVKQGYRCALTGEPLIFHWKHKFMTASLDRIDNSKDYVEGNVQWVHKDINRMKWEYSVDIFRYICRLVYEYNSINLVI